MEAATDVRASRGDGRSRGGATRTCGAHGVDRRHWARRSPVAAAIAPLPIGSGTNFCEVGARARLRNPGCGGHLRSGGARRRLVPRRRNSTRGVRETRYGPLGARNAHDAEPRNPRGSAVFSLCFSAEIDPPHPVERLDDREEELNEGATGTSGRGSTGELPMLAEVPPTDYATIRRNF